MKTKTNLLMLLFLVLGCTSKPSSTVQDTGEKDTQEYPLHIDLENGYKVKGEALLSAEASEIIYIPLETNTNSLIKRINKVIYWNDQLLVSEYFNLHLFDRSGKYLRKVSQAGNGPADYRYVQNIIADPSTGTLYIFSTGRIIKFDRNLTYVNNYKLGEVFGEGVFSTGVMTPEKTFIVYHHNQVRLWEDTTKVYSLAEIDTLGNMVRQYENTMVRYVKSRRNNLMWGYRPLYVYDNNVRFIEFGNDTLFTIMQGSSIPYIILDLGKMKENHNPDYSQIQTFEEVQRLMTESTKLSVGNVLENSNYVYVRLSWGLDGEYVYCVCDRQTKAFVSLNDNGLLNDLDGGIFFFPEKIEANGDMITWKTVEEFKEEILSKDYATQKAKYGERFEGVYQLANSLQEDDNPILVIAKK